MTSVYLQRLKPEYHTHCRLNICVLFVSTNTQLCVNEFLQTLVLHYKHTLQSILPLDHLSLSPCLPRGIPDPFIDKDLMDIREERFIPWQVRTLHLHCLLIRLHITWSVLIFPWYRKSQERYFTVSIKNSLLLRALTIDIMH